MKKYILFFMGISLCMLLFSACMSGALSTAPTPTLRGSSVQSMAFHEPSDIQMVVGGMMYHYRVNVQPADFDAEDILLGATDPEILRITPGTKINGALWFDIVAIKPGKTTIYAQTKDGSVQATGHTVTVKEK